MGRPSPFRQGGKRLPAGVTTGEWDAPAAADFSRPGEKARDAAGPGGVERRVVPLPRVFRRHAMFALPAAINRALHRVGASPAWLSRSSAVAPAVNLALIVGAQRSGTTWLQMLCAAHPRIAGGEESHLFSHYLGNLA